MQSRDVARTTTTRVGAYHSNLSLNALMGLHFLSSTGVVVRCRRRPVSVALGLDAFRVDRSIDRLFIFPRMNRDSIHSSLVFRRRRLFVDEQKM